MPPEDTDPNQRSITKKVIYRFLRGATLGAVVAIIPILYGASIDLNLLQVGAASLLVITCGLLSSVWGEKFIDSLMQVLNSFAP